MSVARLASWVEFFVHPSLYAEPDKLYRARVLIALLLAFFAVSSLVAMIQIISHLSMLLSRPAGLSLCVLAVVITTTLLAYMRRHGDLSICAGVAILSIALLLLFGVGYSGGLQQSPAAQLLVVPPLMAYFFGGTRWGGSSILFILFGVIIFSLSESLGLHVPRIHNTPKFVKYMRLFICFVAIAVVSALSYIYEITAAQLKRERDREHRKTEALAQRDALTGLANRRNFDIHLEQYIAACQALQPVPAFALCYLDLDGFKPINDRYGHPVGDEVLRVISLRLRRIIRSRDFVGRHGGDEFMLLLDGIDDPAKAELLLARMTEVLQQPINTSAGPMQLGASIGIAFFPSAGASVEALEKAADTAMYRAKRAGGRRWCFYDANMRAASHDGALAHLADAEDERAPITSCIDIVPIDTGSDIKKSPPVLQGFARLIDYFVYPALRDEESDQLLRTRILITVLLMICAMMSAICIVFLFAPVYNVEKMATIALCGTLVIGSIYLLTRLRRDGNYRACGALLMGLDFSSIVLGIGISGGAISPAMQVLSSPVMLAYFFGGVRWGRYATLAALTTIIVFAVLDVFNVPFINWISVDTQSFDQLIVVWVILLCNFGAAFIYEYTTANLRRERDAEHIKVQHLAQTDALTGLANRRNFETELRERVISCSATIAPRYFALCCLDLDGFKSINDRYGHAIGDEVLQVTSERLRRCIRSTDYVGRHGGDEFMLILDGIKDERVLERVIQRKLAVIRQPIPTSAGLVTVGGSFGLAIFPDHGRDATVLKKAVDTAMYAAKRERIGWSFCRDATAFSIASE